MRPRILGVIPARFASSRFPGKPLARLAGKTILEHVHERASQSNYITELVIATDDERIAREAREFRATVRMTRPDHPSGTDRAAEIAASSDCEIVVNIQGDEPLIDPAAIDAAILGLLADEQAPMSTLSKRIELAEEVSNPNVVKVVTAHDGRALYFSRSTIPHPRESSAVHFKHIGLYVYRKEFLLAYPDLPVGPLETAEKLEQLRALENGFAIHVVETEYESFGVDTPEDLARMQALFEMALTGGQN